MKKNDETYIQIYLCSFLNKLKLINDNFIFFSVPNGGSRNKREAMNLKLSGLTAGVPDLCILGNNKTFFIELKKCNGKLSAHQISIIDKIKNLGHEVFVIYADTPQSAIEQCIPIFANLGHNQNGMFQVLSSMSFD